MTGPTVQKSSPCSSRCPTGKILLQRCVLTPGSLLTSRVNVVLGKCVISLSPSFLILKMGIMMAVYLNAY